MDQFFSHDNQSWPFVIFSPPHLTTLGIILLLCVLIFLLRHRIPEPQRKTIRVSLAVVLVVNELGWHAWNLAYGTWTIQTMLPLHICSIMVFCTAIMLLTRSYGLYEFLYFLGIGAASQALITPDIGFFGFPHYRFFQTMIAHGTILFAAVYMTVVEGYRPYPKSMLKVAVGLNLYMVFVAVINTLIGSNYLFIAHKPETPSMIDLLGPWPGYILGMEIIGLIVCSLLYLPFFIKDLAARGRKDAPPPNVPARSGAA